MTMKKEQDEAAPLGGESGEEECKKSTCLQSFKLWYGDIRFDALDKLFTTCTKIEILNHAYSAGYKEAYDNIIPNLRRSQDAEKRTFKSLAAANARIEVYKALVKRLEEVHADEQYKGVWELWQSHFGPYNGPTYTKEFQHAIACSALTSSSKAILDDSTASKPLPTGEGK